MAGIKSDLRLLDEIDVALGGALLQVASERRRRLAQGRRRCPIEHLERAEVLAAIPVLEPATTEEIVDRCMARYGSRLELEDRPEVLAGRVRKHLLALFRDGKIVRHLSATFSGWYRRSTLS